MNLHAVQAYFYAANAQLFLTDRTLPGGREEVDALERRAGVALPAAYREFLLWMGGGAGSFLEGLDVFLPSLPLTTAAQELLAENSVTTPLPPDAIVFSMRQGYMFYFLRASEGDDPPIYRYTEGNHDPAFSRVYDSFSTWLAIEIAYESAIARQINQHGRTRPTVTATGDRHTLPVDSFPHAYLDPMKAFFAAVTLTIGANEYLQPGGREEVDALERRAGVALPAAYREFLLWMGGGAGSFLEGLDVFLPNLPLTTAAQELLAENSVTTPLPPDAIVFALTRGQQLFFLQRNKLRNPDDPGVHRFQASPPSAVKPFPLSHSYFTVWLAAEIAHYAARATALRR